MSEWKLIESAPKDGTRILVYDADRAGQPQPGRYRAMGTVYWFKGNDGSEGWIGTTFPGYACYGSMSRPTHWMPLPHPPSQGEREF